MRRKRTPKGSTYVTKKELRKQLEGNKETKQAVLEHNTTVGVAGLGINQIVTSIVSGSEQYQRVGNEIEVTGFYGEFEFKLADTTNHVRCILYTPKDISGPTMAFDGVDVNSVYDTDKYNVWFDKHCVLNSTKNNCVVKLKHKFKYPMKVRYKDQTGGSEVKNRLILYIISDSTASPHVPAIGYWRLFYKD